MRVPGLRRLVPNDRRSTPRQAVGYRLDVLTPDGTVGYLLDISSTGMRVSFKRGLDVAGTQELRVEFPRWLELGAGLDLCGRFVWVRQTEDKVAEGGFAFTQLSQKQRACLEGLIQRLAEAIAADRGLGD